MTSFSSADLNAYPLSIGGASKASVVSAKMIRHYEEVGLIPKAKRTLANYRTYSETDVHTLRFIRQARALGFSIKQIGTLLGLWRDRRRSSSKVKSLALAQIADLDAKIREMRAMKRTLETLAEHCRGDERPECPILENLAAAPDPAKSTGRVRRGRTSIPGLR